MHYAWSDVVEGVRPRVDNRHTCRNYTSILAWAKSRGLGKEDWHPSRRVIEDTSGVLTIQQGRNQSLGGGGDGECNAI